MRARGFERLRKSGIAGVHVCPLHFHAVRLLWYFTSFPVDSRKTPDEQDMLVVCTGAFGSPISYLTKTDILTLIYNEFIIYFLSRSMPLLSLFSQQLDQMAGDESVPAYFAKSRGLLAAQLHRVRAARVELAACGRIGRAWHVSLQNDPLALVPQNR